jgi:Kef-type K+ transport system membrane component KefB
VDHNLATEIASCIIAAWALAVLAHLFKQPLILAYIVAGFVAGPQCLGWVKADEHIELISEIGLSLLLFMVGLEIDLKKMLKAGRMISFTAGAQILGTCTLGLGFFLAISAPLTAARLDALYLAVAAALSSTVIIVKILHDKQELDTLPGRLTLGVLVLQDLFAILFLALQPNLRNPSLLLLLASLGKVIVLVAAALLASRFALPTLFRTVARVPEVVLVGALAWCFLVAGLAKWLGLSREMGALIAGVAISTFPYALDVGAKVITLRDFFVTLFFVSLGLRTPAPTVAVVVGALLMAVFVLVSRFVTVVPVLHWLRLGHRASLLPAIHLSQLSEFSLVILVLGVQAGHIGAHSLNVASYAFALTAVLSSYAIVKSDPLVRRLAPMLERIGVQDLEASRAETAFITKPARVMLLGFFRTASSLIVELERTHPDLLKDVTVVDFSPVVNERLRKRNVKVIYGDISQRETLFHAGADRAEVLVCTLPDSVLKGTNNLRLVRQLREMNREARIIATAESFTDVPSLRAAGADYVSIPRLAESTELNEVLSAALNGTLSNLADAREPRLAERNEVLP